MVPSSTDLVNGGDNDASSGKAPLDDAMTMDLSSIFDEDRQVTLSQEPPPEEQDGSNDASILQNLWSQEPEEKDIAWQDDVSDISHRRELIRQV